MNGFSSVVGQPMAVAFLRSAIAANRLGSAYLFVGDVALGKATTATALAQELNCLGPAGGGACGSCDACVQLAEGNHPDFLTISPDGQLIKIAQIRELTAALAFRPHQGRSRVVVIDPADQLTTEAANALLKTLEEPPADTHFVLVSAVAGRVPITLRSRCQRVRFVPIETTALVGHLIKSGIAEEVAASAAAQSQGSLARALLLANASGASEQTKAADELLELLSAQKDKGMLMDFSVRMRDSRDEVPAVLDLLSVTFRDAYVLAQGNFSDAGPHLLRPDRRAAAERLSMRGRTRLSRDLQALFDVRAALMGNTHLGLCLDHLLLALSASSVQTKGGDKRLSSREYRS